MLGRLALLALVSTAGGARADDLRVRYGTRSLAAAKAIARAIKLESQKRPAEALAEIDRAIKIDPTCAPAHFEKAVYLNQVGKIAESLEAYKQCLAVAPSWQTGIAVEAQTNMGLTLGRLKKYDESNLWFSRAIMADPSDRENRRWKAFRNMAINLHAQQRYLSAGLAALQAYRANPERVGENMVEDFLKMGRGQEAATVLFVSQRPPTAPERKAASKLEPVAIGGDAVKEAVFDLLVDPRGRHVVALAAKKPYYYVISFSPALSAKKISLDGAAACGAMAGGELYLIVGDPPKLVHVEVMTGRAVRSWELKAPVVPTSVAVLPARKAAFFPVKKVLHGLNLATGKTFETEIDGQFVEEHPSEKFVYSFLKPDRRSRGPRSGMVIINGRPVHFQLGGFGPMDWSQSTLFRSLVVPDGLILAGVRENAASNARRLVVSADGKWAAAVGGGGWRPQNKQGKGAGYGVAVFSAADLCHVQGFFKTDAYPRGAAFNCVTGQLAVVREGDVKVYHLADQNNSVVLPGKFAGVCAWSGNGRHLLAAAKGGGLSAYSNALTKAEQKLAKTWWRSVRPTSSAPAPRPAPAKPLAMLKGFAVKDDKAAVEKALARALKQRRTDLPERWHRFEPYAAKGQLVQGIFECVREGKKPANTGMVIFKLRQMLEKHPKFVPLKYFLATALHRSGQVKEAEAFYLQAVCADAGRTELTCRALDGLHDLHARKDKPMAAAYCLAASLCVDLANPRTLELMHPLLDKPELGAQQKALAKLRSDIHVAPPPSRLSALGAPPDDSPKLSAEELFQKAVTSTVLIRAGGTVGTGVCVAKAGVILTNQHVVRRGGVEVWAYESRDGKVVRCEKTAASVIFTSDRHDIAVLELKTVPAAMKPLPVAARNPRAGQKVYAIGNPGVGKEILVQSISEGIISSNSRTIEGNPYLQHTAAVNPGNSGGPLLDERCHVVGINTLKVSLENVSFAIPAQTVRGIFPSK